MLCDFLFAMFRSTYINFIDFPLLTVFRACNVGHR